jgi:hypothetical protein
MAPNLTTCKSSGLLSVGTRAVLDDIEKALNHLIVFAVRPSATIPKSMYMGWRSMMRYVEAFIESHEGHFEQLL